jgi:flagella basal body P-ring formation protein FlgA
MIRLLAVALLLGAVPQVTAARQDSSGSEVLRTVPSGQVRDVTERYLEEKSKNIEEEVSIVIRSMPERMTWKGSSLTMQVEENPSLRMRGPATVVVNLVVDGQVQNRVVVSVIIRTFAQVLVAARQLTRHAVIRPEDVRGLRMETTFLQRPLLLDSDSLSTYRTRRLVSAGSILYKDVLEPQPLVFEGEDVMVTVSEGSVRLTTRAVAAEDGWKGDMIAVRREGTRETVKARVEATGLVAIGRVGKEQP